MITNLWNSIIDWFSDTSERGKLVRDFNYSAKKAYVEGIAPTLLKSKISRGSKSNKHKFSHWLNTGFRIQAFTGRQLGKEEILYLGKVILADDRLIRRMIVLGWDTLEIHDDTGVYGCRWQLKDYLSLPNVKN